MLRRVASAAYQLTSRAGRVQWGLLGSANADKEESMTCEHFTRQEIVWFVIVVFVIVAGMLSYSCAVDHMVQTYSFSMEATE